ncbi:hypothetical protein K438DRAFT_1781646 [Mycena galopus ATCC 62051]|nr:hypothetical protein K438DRAFT_1781646 [Mycena galopus ATCC 62051]
MNMGFSAAAVRNYQPVLTKRPKSAVIQGILYYLYPYFPDTFSAAGLGCSTEDLEEEFLANNSQIVALSSSQSAPHIFAIGACLPNWVWRTAIRAPITTFKDIRDAKYLTSQLGEKIVRGKLNLARQGLEINTDVFGILLEQYLWGKTRHALNAEEVAAQTVKE